MPEKEFRRLQKISKKAYYTLFVTGRSISFMDISGNGNSAFIQEPARNIPVAADVDICVLGGSCTGVFAAVRAARMGARVAIVEKQNSFGGVATSGLVNTWSSLCDLERKEQIIAGLTEEVLSRLLTRDAVVIDQKKPAACIFNSEELKIELDELVVESKLKAYLHTYYAAPHLEGNSLKAVVLENKSGRFAIRARFFIDATGDGDLCAQVGAVRPPLKYLQPPTTCVKLTGINEFGCERFKELARKYGAEFDLHEFSGWGGSSAMADGLTLHAETHVYHADCADGDSMTSAEIEGRRQIRAMLDIIRKYGNGGRITLADLPSSIGIRETRRAHCRYSLTEEDVLSGKPFEDAIAFGSRQVDLHHHDKPGMTFKFLDGREVYLDGARRIESRWRRETPTNPPYWQVPYRCLLPRTDISNMIVCGRMIDADEGAFGAVRLMVTTNQMGEAAGVAACLALSSGISFSAVDPLVLRKALAAGGSAQVLEPAPAHLYALS